ncbi:MAG: FAD-dependent oxidoreductase [Halobacteriales archaeon]
MRVAVFGAGYAGITVARRIEQRLPDADLVVVDEDGTHLVQQELHRLIRRPDLADHLSLPVDELLADATVRTARVEEIAPERRAATLSDGATVEYDVGAVALGAQTAFYGLAGVEEHATPMKQVAHAETVRREFLEHVDDGRVVVGGAGLSGIQVSGELAALADDRGRDATVTLLEQKDRVAPALDRRFSRAVAEELADAGIEIRTGTGVASADADAIELDDGTRLPYEQFVWTGGIRGTAPFSGDRPEVRSTMVLADRTFVLGDAARVVDREGKLVPATAQAATREGEVVARSIERLATRGADGGFEPRLEQFNFRPRGWVASVGDEVVAQVGPAVLTGQAARTAKAAISARHLAGIGAVRDAFEVATEELGLAD